MTLFTVEEVREVVNAKVLAGEEIGWTKCRIRRISLDTRSLQPGDLFLALSGDRFDGHDFVATALSRGAMGAIVLDSYDMSSLALKRGSKRTQPFIFGVSDPLYAYQQLAAYHRSRFEIPIVAVTGSNGKTTTKEMVAGVMAHCWKILKTEGNLNNRLGVPQTLLRLNDRHKGAVIEMGVDNLGQTTRLCEIARPRIGIITNIGPDHLEFFGTMEVSAQAKAELLDLLPRDGTAILNADDSYYDYLTARARCRVVSFGLSSKANVRAMDVKSDGRNGRSFVLCCQEPYVTPLFIFESRVITMSPMPWLPERSVRSWVCPGGVIAQGLSRFRPAVMRSQVRVNQGVKLIIDCYNANPASMKAAVQLLMQMGAKGKKIAVLGDMLELGPNTDQHARGSRRIFGTSRRRSTRGLRRIGRSLAEGAKQAGLDPTHILEALDARTAAAVVKTVVKPGDAVLIKASRGMKLELVADALRGATRMTKKAS